MSLILSILGFLVTAAGVVALGFGIPISEFSLGNTMIVAGTIAAAAGLILIGLGAAVGQLNQIANALRPGAAERPAARPQAAQPQAVEQAFQGRQGPFPAQPPVPAPMPAPVQAPPQGPGRVPVPGLVRPPMQAPPPRGPVFAKPRVEERVSEPAPAESAEAPFSAIERLRSSLARADRKAGDAADAEDDPYSAGAPFPAAGPGPGADVSPNMGAGANGAAPADGAAAEDLKKPSLDFLFRSKLREPTPEPFDAVWPKRGPRRSDVPADAGEPARPAAAEAPIERPSRSPDELRPAAILKSGVVDGMAYTLYADGSIEAQLPQGTVRFGSIAELRAHIENNS
jgi:hypothetical protein